MASTIDATIESGSAWVDILVLVTAPARQQPDESVIADLLERMDAEADRLSREVSLRRLGSLERKPERAELF